MIEGIKEIIVYTDGSSTPQKKNRPKTTKAGGWAFCLTEDKNSNRVLHSDYGFKNGTTNNRMEMTAVINALYYCYFNMTSLNKIVVYSDSKYVSDPIYFGWLNDWRANDYQKKNSYTGEVTETKNADLWEELYQLLKKYKFRGIEVDICWVKGHNGDYFNELCDALAKKGKYDKTLNPKYE